MPARNGALAAVFAAGCGATGLSYPGPPAPAEIEQAFAAVWDDIYDAAVYQRPVVVFDAPNCDSYDSPGITTSTGACVLGWTGQHETHVLWLGSWRASAFAHELFHSYIRATTPPQLQSVVAGDPRHEDPRWISIVRARAAEWGAPDLTY